MAENTINSSTNQGSGAVYSGANLANESLATRQRLAEIVEEFERKIELAYPPASKFPYHNIEHHLDPMCRDAVAIAERCWKSGLQPEILVIRAAARGHDAAMGIDPAAFGAQTAEEAAAKYCSMLLRSLGAPIDFCQAVADSIEDTHVRAVPRSLEAQIVRAADLASIGRSYEEVVGNTQKLHQEREQVTGASIPYTGFVGNSLRLLSGYFSHLIALTPTALDEAGRSRWHIAGLSNITKLYREEMGGRQLCVILGGSSEQIESEIEDGALLITTGEAQLSDTLTRRTIVFKVPGTASSFPLADGSADLVYTPALDSAAVAEAQRVVSPTGKLIARS